MILFFLLQYEDPSTGVEYDSNGRRSIISTPTKLTNFVVPSSVEYIKGGDSSKKSSFFNCRSSIVSVVFETGSKLSNIDEWVFADSSLQTIDMEACTELEQLSRGLFQNAANLSSIKFPKNLKRLRAGCFYLCSSLKAVTFPDSLERIDAYEGGFNRMFFKQLESVSISRESNLTAIYADAFMDSKLKYFYIPSKLTTITPSAFSNVPIERFEIDDRNPVFKTDGKVIFANSNNVTLFLVSSAVSGTFQVPSFVTKISSHCFRGGSVQKIILHNKITKIDNWAFASTDIVQFDYVSSITTIEHSTFKYAALLETVNLSDTIISIGESAFYSCHKLKNIVLPSRLQKIDNLAFGNCESLTKLILPGTVTSMGQFVFTNCLPTFELDCTQNDNFYLDNGMFFIDSRHTLSEYFGNSNRTDISIPPECTSIALSVFENSNIRNVVFSNSAELNVGKGAFYLSEVAHVTFPSSLKSLGDYCFKNCKQLETIIFQGNSITEIPSECFSGCTKLRDFVLPSSIEVINIKAFLSCTSIGDVLLDKTNVRTILAEAFKDSGLSKIALPSTAETLDYSCFQNTKTTSFSAACNISMFCLKNSVLLTTVTLKQCVVTIGDSAFEGCTELESVSLSASVESIRYYAFQSCAELSKFNIELNSNLNEIYGGCFNNCPNLVNLVLDSQERNLRFSNGALTDWAETKIICFLPGSNINTFIVPTSMRTIGNYAFQGAARLTRVLFNGNQINDIGYQAFKGCTNLNFLFFNSPSLTVLNPSAFEDCPSLQQCGTVSCPTSLQSLFKAAKFKEICFKVDCPMKNECTVMCRLT